MKKTILVIVLVVTAILIQNVYGQFLSCPNGNCGVTQPQPTRNLQKAPTIDTKTICQCIDENGNVRTCEVVNGVCVCDGKPCAQIDTASAATSPSITSGKNGTNLRQRFMGRLKASLCRFRNR